MKKGILLCMSAQWCFSYLEFDMQQNLSEIFTLDYTVNGKNITLVHLKDTKENMH